MKFYLSYSAVLFLLLSLRPSGAQAQRRAAAFPAPVPAPAADPMLRRGAGHAGSYQALDGQWYTVQIDGWENDRVYLRDEGGVFAAYSPTDLKRFVYLGDTVVAADAVAMPRRRFLRRPQPRLVPAAFARQLYRGGGFQLLSYDPARPATLTTALSSSMLLRSGNEPWQVLPTNTVKFNQLMLTLLGTDPELVPGLQAGQYHLRRDAAQLLERYADWQTHRFLQSAAQSGR
ncbi:hypothetical protein KBK19_12590 [Microvirga sp. STR05]|uniref:Uncharacterized protein n=1 Tax=Hymenobacter duratus TaxID=2771356 RepID=A0ABR8JG84_9BACT|nr:hypothetical protein [Hymenobacter duratus]MBD2715875.1 hypothetical protein [Hymenobacter duratus]MBR7950786.1 hypothetical protein [Microvirga sp. STR05]